MPRVRVHQHVNPLAKYFRELPIEPLDLEKRFADPSLPIHLDIGAGRGRFLLEMAKIEKSRNFLGVEIREPLVAEANKIAAEQDLENLRYEFCNATIDLDVLLEKVPNELLQFVSIQFPDPWFKKKHKKRRMVKDKLVETVSEKLSKDGRIFVQTDIEFLFEEISEMFARRDSLKRLDIAENFLPVKTEREKSVENRNLPVFRAVFSKKA